MLKTKIKFSGKPVLFCLFSLSVIATLSACQTASELPVSGGVVELKDSCKKVETMIQGIAVDLNKEGVGLSVSKLELGGKILIADIVSTGPADRSNAIAVGDEVVAVSPNADNHFLLADSMSLPDLVHEIRGCDGTPLTLKMKRSGSVFDVELRREGIRPE